MGLIAELLQELFADKSRKVKVLHKVRNGMTVRRSIVPLWQEKNWKQKQNRFIGYYRTKYGAFKGEIIEPYRGSFQFFIFDPPSCLSRHSHFACFIPKQKGVYEVHFSKKARTPDEGILAIEKILVESHRLQK